MRAATPKRGTSLRVRVQRPPEIVVTGALSSLLFARRRTANLIPLSNGLAYFAARAEQSLFRIASRFGQSTAYTTAFRALITLSDGQADHLRHLAASKLICVSVTLDNAQHFGAQYDVRAGRADIMYKGVVGNLLIWQDCPPSALNETAMNAYVAARKAGPGDLSWRTIVSDIDRAFIQQTGEIHWLDVIVSRCGPLRSAYQEHVALLFSTKARKHQIPPTRRTVAHPLRSNAHDPSLATGLKDAVMDFYSEQLGITPETWSPRLMFFSGDGGTFEGLGRLRKYSQIAPTPYERLDWMVKQLHLWHMKWTAACRTFNNNWGSDRSVDPSCLGNNARIIKRKTPSNLKKIDFARDSETMFTIGENRMLDCWRVILDVEDLDAHFETLAASNKLPSFDELRKYAARLYRTYSCHRAYLQALQPYERQSAAYRAPLSQAIPAPTVPSHASTAAGVETAGVSGHVEEPGFAGDRCLANSILFLEDFVELREWYRSTSVGEIGSTWEIVKNQIPKFAGSGHNPNYLNYCLETYHMVEKEFPPALREAFLNNWLVNFVGRPGHFKEGDLMQEHFINRLDRHLQHKDRAYDEPFIRNIVSPNLDILSDIPRQLEDAVSLKARSNRHLTPQTKVEDQLLAEHYRQNALHRFCKGRSLGFAAKDHISIGVSRLMDPADALKRFRDVRSNMDVFGAPTTYEPIQPMAPPEPAATTGGTTGASMGTTTTSSPIVAAQDADGSTECQADAGGDSDADEDSSTSSSEPAPSAAASETQIQADDGMEDQLLNDPSEEVQSASHVQRTAIRFTDGHLHIEETGDDPQADVHEVHETLIDDEEASEAEDAGEKTDGSDWDRASSADADDVAQGTDMDTE